MSPRSLSLSSSSSSSALRAILGSVETARHYSLRKFRKDVVAGLTVSVVELPQAMAYALIAGVPPQYGIYTSIIQGFIGALLSSSEHMTTGPTNTQSLLVASAVTRIAQPGDVGTYLQLVFALTIIKGLIQLAFGAAGLGNMVRFISRSVIIGVTSGAGVLIIANQIPNVLGISAPRGPHDWPGVFGAVQRVWPNLGAFAPASLWIAAGCIAMMLGARALSRFIPGALIAIVLSAVIVAQSESLAGGSLPLVGKLPEGLPLFRVPQIGWAEAEALFGAALALAIQGILETVAIAKSIASHTGERIDANQEFFSQGLKNAISGFFQCIPGSGSFTRSALDYAAGAETRFAAVFNALFVAVLFFALGDFARYIPMAALGAVLLVIAFGLIDWRYLLRLMRTNRAEAVVCVITFAATLSVPLEYAIFIGAFLSLGLYVRTASRLHIAEMIPSSPGGGAFVERPIHDRAGQKQVVFLQVEGDLFFGVADELHERLTQLLHGGGSNSEVRIVILRLKRTHSLDSTVLHELEQFTRQLRERGGGRLILCGVRPELMGTLKGYGLDRLIGPENIFPAGPGVFTSAKLALNRARELLASSIDDADIDVAEEAADFEI